MEKIKQAPTAEQVCEVLSEYYSAKVIFENNKNKQFMVNNKLICYLFKYNYTKVQLIDFKDILPAHIVILIGEFYEGVI